MGRELKFRAWDEKQKHMAYQGTPDLENIQSFMFHYGDNVLMQYTGFKDTDGREIYEGDILGDWCDCDGEMVQSREQVYFDDASGAWMLDHSGTQNRSFCSPLSQNLKDFKYSVLGSIYGSPRLMPISE